MKRPFLVLYDYGTGGVWAYLRAESPDQIHSKFRDLTVFDKPPDWMTEGRRREIEASRSYDVDTAETDDPIFFAKVLRHGA